MPAPSHLFGSSLPIAVYRCHVVFTISALASSCLIAVSRRSWCLGLLLAERAAKVGRFRPRPTGAFRSDIFREIDGELRRDNLLKLWSRYGRCILAFAGVGLGVA